MNYDDHLNLLNSTHSSSLEDIKKSYRNLLMKYHPDKNKGGADMCVKLNLSYEWLEKHHVQQEEIKIPEPKPKRDLTGYEKYFRVIDETNIIILPYDDYLDDGIVINCILGLLEFRIVLEKGTYLPTVLKITNVGFPLTLTIKGDEYSDYRSRHAKR